MTETVAANVHGKPSRPPAGLSDDNLFSSLLDVLGEGILVLDDVGVIQRTNAAYTRMTGRSVEELVGRSFADFLPDDLKQPAMEQFATILKDGGATPDMEWPLARKDGSRGAVRCRVRPATLADGSRRWLVAMEDLSELRRLEERERIFNKVLSSAPVILFSLDKDGNYTTWEGRGVETLGSRPGEWVGQNALEQWKNTDAHGNLVRALGGEEFSTSLVIPGPLYYDVWYLPVKDSLGNANGMIGLGWDVSRMRAVEDELREKVELIERQKSSLQLLQRVIESAPFVVASLDVSGTFTACDGKGLEALGTKPGEYVGQNAFEVYNNPEIAEALTKTLGGEEVRLVTNLAPEVFFEAWLAPLTDSHTGEISGANMLALDVTERMRAELELRDKLELIERQSATIRALATPIIKVWDEVLCLPVIGTVDSARTAEMMDALLQSIVREQARFAVVDLTGVEVVDTSTADHVIQLFKAANVLGVEGILCGIRPAVAQTVVALGVDLTSVRTMRTLQDALKYCIRTRNVMLEKMASRRPTRASSTSAAKAKT